MVRRFCKRKTCCLVIAISQAGIAAPTLTVMQGFEANKDCSVHFLPRSCVLRLYSVFFHSMSILRILPFHFLPRVEASHANAHA